jgi:hypothetical protein
MSTSDDVKDNNVLKNLIYSATSTGVAEIITLPICTIKTNFQNSKSTSIIKTKTDIYLKNGIKGFYQASLPAITGQMFSTSSKYTIYRYLEGNKDADKKTKVINGAVSGVLSSLITHPLDVAKINLQNINSGGYTTLRLLLNRPSNFYHGYSKTLSKVLVGSALFFPLKDIYSELFNSNKNKKDTSVYISFASSFSSAITATLIMHPLDYLKVRHIGGQSLYDGWNPKIYYKGLSLNLLRIVPHFTITMMLIDWFDKK